MNFEITIDASLINDKNHLINLHKHVTRTAKKIWTNKTKSFCENYKTFRRKHTI